METIKSRKHRRKIHRIVMFTSDAVNSKVRQIKLSPFAFRLLTLIICVIIGAAVGYAAYGGLLFKEYRQREQNRLETMQSLQTQNEELILENQTLTEKVAILSETVNQKVLAEQELNAQAAAESMPTEFPLTGSATVTESTTDSNQPICIFTASEGTTAVASGTGKVIVVGEDVTYGTKVAIDHGNGYVSIYLNKGSPKVKVGDEVDRGTTIFVISSDNTELGYQMTHEEGYINPMDMIAISG